MSDTYSELDLWNDMSYIDPNNSIGDYDPYSSVVDSSGNSLKGLNLGGLIKAGGSGVQAWGQLLAGDAMSAADESNAALALQAGSFAVDNIDSEESHILSSQRAIYAKSGVTMSGSPLDVALNTASRAEMQKQVATYNAQSKANQYQYQADVAKSQAKIKAGETLLSGAVSAFTGLL